ncbi:MAG TPA: 50S ribosomal protein L4 [Nitratifractor sp.]|nr:50S ribosomal protein L4 [Nitratifractor sp.]HHD74834.1 50S ribosomal protein L4 [Nitratifractor sp.]
MSNTVVKTADLPQSFLEVHPHNLYLYCKAYAANLRASSAHTKNRSAVSGGGKKPFAQKGGGRARQGSIRAPQFRGGGVVFGPTNAKNYTQKVNKKQKRLALMHAVAEKVANERVFIVDSIEIESGKTKDAVALFNSFNQRDVLFVKELIDDKTFLAFRNVSSSYLVEPNELNGYLAAAYSAIVIEKSVWENLVKES